MGCRLSRVTGTQLMNTFMAIMSQLFWGVTIGALSAAFETVAKGVVIIAGIGGIGWYGVKRRRCRQERDRQRPDRHDD